MSRTADGTRPASIPLVGRRAELTRARAALATAGALVVAGPVGVGKTRFVREVVAELAAAGRPVTELDATAATSAVPFGAVRPLLATAPIATGGAIGQAARPADELLLLAAAAESAASSGAIIAVDDAHLLDSRSAALLHRIVRERRAPVVATIRSGEPAPDAVDALWHDGLATHLELGPLDFDDTCALAEQGAGRPLGPSEAESLWGRTGGNPLFLFELLRGPGTQAVDVDLVAAVRERLDSLTPDRRRVVELVALAEPAPLSVLDPELDVLEDLEEGGLVAVTERGLLATARLHHPLYAEVARAELSPDQRADLAGQLADRIIAAGPQVDDPELRACALLRSAGTAPQSTLAITAARQALARSDTDLARSLACDVLGQGPDYDATLLLGDLDRFAGDGSMAEARYVEAGELATTDAQIAEVAIARAQLHTFLYYDDRRAAEVAAEARARIVDPRVLLELDASTALALDTYADTAMASTRVLEHPERTPEATWSAALIGAWVGVQHLQIDEADRLATLASGHAPLAADRPAECDMLAAIELGIATAAGRLPEAASHGWAHVQRARAEGRSSGLAAMVVAQVEWLRGRWDRAVDALHISLTQLRDLDQFHVVHVVAAHRAMAETWRGDLEAADAALAEAHRTGGTSDPFGMLWVGRAEAWRSLAGGHVETAMETLVHAGHQSNDNHAWSTLVLHDAVALGQVEGVLDRLREIGSVVQGAPLHRLLVAHAEALADGDGRALAQVAAGLEALGALAPAAPAWAQAATVLGADSAEACRAATRWHVLAERWDPRSPVLGEPPRGVALSSRQLGVARLAADGASAAAIAQRLGISSRTVDNHLAAAYRRTGARGRADLGELLQISGPARAE